VSRVWPFMSPLADKPDALDVAREQTLDTVDEQDDGDRVCPECNGDGGDKWNDYILPCPACNGERYLP
jgi:DnaJ-class molecular chaperone